MDKIFGFSIKRAVVIMVCFVGLAAVTTFITYYQLKPFAVKSELSELVVNDITFAGIFINNLIVSTVAVLGVFLFRIPSILVLLVNPIVLGFVLGSSWVSTNEIYYFISIIIPHSIFEIPALSIACAIGTEGGKIFGKYSKSSILRACGLIVILLLIAAFVECNISAKNI